MKRIFAFYGLIFFILFLLSVIGTVCIAKIDPYVTVSYLFSKNILLNLLVYPFYQFYKLFGIVGLAIVLVFLALGLCLPVVCSIKKKKVFPYSLIFIVFLAFYFFVGFPCFLFKGDLVERAAKDYSKIEGFKFCWHEGSRDDYSFADSDSNTIHIVSYRKRSIDDDAKLALVNGQKIIDAINSFYNENKSYPDSLEQLLPKYLEKIPETEDTGIWTSGDFIYEKDDSDRWYHLKFYGFFEEYYWHNERRLWEYEED